MTSTKPTAVYIAGMRKNAVKKAQAGARRAKKNRRRLEEKKDKEKRKTAAQLL